MGKSNPMKLPGQNLVKEHPFLKDTEENIVENNSKRVEDWLLYHEYVFFQN